MKLKYKTLYLKLEFTDKVAVISQIKQQSYQVILELYFAHIWIVLIDLSSNDHCRVQRDNPLQSCCVGTVITIRSAALRETKTQYCSSVWCLHTASLSVSPCFLYFCSRMSWRERGSVGGRDEGLQLQLWIFSLFEKILAGSSKQVLNRHY